jgi:CheY-like chemotaxis protein
MRKRFQKQTHVGWYLFIVVSTAAVFVIDLQTMVNVATWLFYLVPLAACWFISQPAVPLWMALTASLLIAIDFVLSAPGVSVWISQLNRSFAVIVIWAFAIQMRLVIQGRLHMQQRDWMREAQSHLAERIIGEQSLGPVGRCISEFLGEYLHAAVVALYSRDQQDSVSCIGGYALPPEHVARADFKRGEGLIGQVMASRKPMWLQSVPAGHLDASSALGAIRPVELLVSPILTDGEVVGAIELGFLEPLVAADLELLLLLGDSIGIALRTARLRSEREELLRSTQRQAEQLQSQQQELRAVNEELEQQGNLLRESQAHLETQQAELEQTNVQLEEQAQLLSRHNEHLNVARRDLLVKARELERSNQFKSEFLANMSHELRTPLNSSLILAKLLADNSSGNLTAEQVKFARSIYSAGNDLLELINDILDLSKIEARQIEVKRERVEPPALAENMLQVFRPMAREKNLAFEVQVDPGVPVEVHTDSQRVRQILRNLLSNALKFTLQGQVRLHVFVPTAAPQWLAFAVEDTGIGIDAEQHAVVFEPFRQADGTTNRRFAGTGLGLSISRELATMLGGRIELRSAVGAGSTFTLLIPQTLPEVAEPARTAVRPAPQSVVPPSVAAGTRVSVALPEPSPAVAEAPVLPAAGTQRRSLLIIEDDAVFARTIATVAANMQFEALLASTADEGIELALRHRPTAIVLDVRLPDHTGLAVLDRLKHDSATRHIPVQVISGVDYTQAALQMGAANFLLKPVEREQLVAALIELDRKAQDNTRAVLIVEDNAVQRDSISQLLQSDAVRTVAVATVSEALQQLRTATFDCMVLDLTLPDANGHELLEKLATDESCLFPPVIVYTGRTLSADEEQQLRRYSKSIIVKGARSPERLLDEVTLFLHRIETSLPPEQQRLLRVARSREAMFEGRCFLLVEDDVRNVFAITRVLEPHGARVEIGRNGREALAALERNPKIALVLMDIMMPEMDGLEAMRAIRAQPKLANLPIIALTAKAMPDDRQRCLDAGANDYVTKPIDIDKLLSLLRIWMPPRQAGAD